MTAGGEGGPTVVGSGRPFTFLDGERLIRFGEGVVGEAPALLAERGFERYALLTTERARASAPAVVDVAATVLVVPAGGVPDAAAAVRAGAAGRPLVALGGGRVVDAAKAIAAADGLACAAIPTTLAGSPFTPFHRLPAGAEVRAAGRGGQVVRGSRLVRPALVVADPALMASLPGRRLVATAMNALAHAMESLYAPGSSPVAEMAALRAAALFAAAVPATAPPAGADSRPAELPGADPRPAEPPAEPPAPAAALALAAFLAGYAVGTTGLAVHHAVCQTIVRRCDTPHAETNAVLLPHSARFMAGRAPRELGAFARALGDPAGDPAAAGDLIAALATRAGVTGLGALGLTRDDAATVVGAVAGHPGLQNTPGGVSRRDVAGLLTAAH